MVVDVDLADEDDVEDDISKSWDSRKLKLIDAKSIEQASTIMINEKLTELAESKWAHD